MYCFLVVLQLKIISNSFLSCVATQTQLEFFFELWCNSKSVRVLLWVVLQLKIRLFLWVVLPLKLSFNSFLSCDATQNQFGFFFELCCNSKSVWILFWVVLQLSDWTLFLSCVSTISLIFFWVVLQLKISFNSFLSCVATISLNSFF